MDQEQRLEPGTLWARTVRVTRRAAESGALCPVSTRTLILHQNDVDFVVRVLGNIARKRAAGSRRLNMAAGEGERRDPFLPYERDLFVARIGPSHLALLNKYNVLDHHLLIVTSAFEHQECLLTRADFEALWVCMMELDGLAFYNGGLLAGASQPHKHLQLVPLPLGPGTSRIPLATRILAATVEPEPTRSPALSFPHLVSRLDPGALRAPASAARYTLGLYRHMLDLLGVEGIARAGGIRQSRPYNLLVTREWMLVVPRTREGIAGVPVNALGFAGAMLVKDDAGLGELKRRGAMEILRLVSS
jgi:ATP adenylyltransferase